MRKQYYNSNNYYNPQPFIYSENDERFIGPVIPFIGGALIGYIAGRPQYSYNSPSYYPVYYYPTYPYYPQMNYYPATNQ